MRFDLHAAAVLAPGLGSLADLLTVCRSGRPPDSSATLALPSPAALPANERRRASQVVRLTLECIDQVLRHSLFPPESLRSVFATDEGTGEVCQLMLDAVACTGRVSPLVFPNSVQNAPSGYFAIAWRNQQPATVVSLGLESAACGLLCAVTEARASGQPVLFVAYDPVMTSPLDECLPVTEPTATAWILSDGARSPPKPVLGSFELELLQPGSATASPAPSWLPAAWEANSSARALAALGLLAVGPGAMHRLSIGSQLVELRLAGVGP